MGARAADGFGVLLKRFPAYGIVLKRNYYRDNNAFVQFTILHKNQECVTGQVNPDVSRVEISQQVKRK